MVGDWYAIQAKPHTERLVLRRLTSKQIPALLPLIEIVRRRRARRVGRIEPAFPSYLFVRLGGMEKDARSWQTVRWTPGVRGILGAGATPTPIPAAVIEGIQERMRALGFIRPRMPFVQGSRVHIRRGPLLGLQGVFDRPVSRAGRARVLLELLGQPRRLEVDVLDLEAD